MRDECLREGGDKKCWVVGDDDLRYGEQSLTGDIGDGVKDIAGVGGEMEMTVSMADCLSSLREPCTDLTNQFYFLLTLRFLLDTSPSLQCCYHQS